MKLVICIALLLCSVAFAQTLPGWTVAINGNFSNISNASTNNGFATIETVRVSDHFAVRADQLMTVNPAGAEIFLFKAEYRRLLSDFIKPNPYLNTANFEPFVNAGGGTAQSNNGGVLSTSRPAFAVGGGFDMAVGSTGMFTIRPLDISYVRASILQNGGTLIGNHLSLFAGIGLRFGSIATMQKNKAARAAVKAKYYPQE
jgi:hypothetical protein